MSGVTETPDTGPHFPDERGGVAILGCGTIAQSAHLPAYEQHGVGVAGVWSRSAGTTATVRERFPFVGRVYASAEELLADPEVRYVDLATGPEGRLEWLEAAIDAGKHVLAQKPLTLSVDDLVRLPDVLARARAAGVRVAVNHNGRWAPPWRATTLLLRQGAIGDVVGVTHLHDKPLPPLVGDSLRRRAAHAADRLPPALGRHHAHLAGRRHVGAGRPTPGSPGSRTRPATRGRPRSRCTAATGATATLRIAGSVVSSEPGCPFWVHGTTGTLRGSVLIGSDRLELDDGTRRTPVPLSGAWFVDGFAAAMGELMCAVAEDREPENSAADAASSVVLVLAAAASAERGGVPVDPAEVLA